MKKYNVLGIGNAVVDVISQSSDMFLEKMNIEKGIMQLVDRDRGELLYNSMDNRKQAPGGSVANTIAGIGALGLKTGFIGKVGTDELGVFYRDTMEENGTASAGCYGSSAAYIAKIQQKKGDTRGLRRAPTISDVWRQQ